MASKLDIMKEQHPYEYRMVSVGHDWHIEIRGFNPADEVELNELLRTLHLKHGWPQSRQVFVVGPREVGMGIPQSPGLMAYDTYLSKTRSGPSRNDVRVAAWVNDSVQ